MFRPADSTEEQALSSKVSGLRLESGDVVRLETAGGGGHGPASERDLKASRHDREEGYIS
jgi:N-methylhydantoinase B